MLLSPAGALVCPAYYAPTYYKRYQKPLERVHGWQDGSRIQITHSTLRRYSV
jgi:hypothetical protein